MVILKEKLTDLKEVYEKAIRLVCEESKNDPVTAPFRSHYAARDLLLVMMENLHLSLDSKETEDAESEFIFKVILAFVCRDLGRIYVFTEERSNGEKYLNECLDVIAEYKMKPAAIIPYIGALNEIGIVYAGHGEYKNAFDMLSKAEEAYKDFKATGLNAMCVTDVFGTPDEIEHGKGTAELESLYTLCSFYLAQVLGHLGELEKSAQYCHMTLCRQLESKTYEPIDFALNAATLSQYYIGQNMFTEARHHLAAATLILAEHEANAFNTEMTEAQRGDMTETLSHRRADLARCWAKYGLALLSASKERLYCDDDDKLVVDVKRLSVKPADSYRFPNLKVTPYEDRITADYCLTFDDAKLVYHFIISWLDEAKEYYTAETEATEYAKIIKDYAELYQHIAFFEEDPINQSKMQKRRAKYYEDLLDMLNPVFYMNICRDCWYGAGLAQCAILDIKLDAVKASSTPSPQELLKVNQICQRTIEHFMAFVKSYMDKEGAALKTDLTVEEQSNVLYAYFHLGRLHYKMITPDLAQQLENMQNSLKYYKLFTDECSVRKEAAETLQAEIGVCKEMVSLLPLKIANLKKRMNK